MAVFYLAQSGSFGLQLGTGRDNRHRLGNTAHLQGYIDSGPLLHIDGHRAGHCFLETCFFDGYLIAADLERTGDVLALRIGCGSDLRPTVDVGDRDLGPVDNGIGGVSDKPSNAPGIFLCRRRNAGE